MKFETIKKNKKMIVIGVFAAIILIAGAFIIKSTYSISDTQLANQVVDKLSFENAKVTVDAGVTTFTANVINDSGATYNLKTIKVTLNNGSNFELLGYIGDEMDANENKVLKISTDQEINNVKSVSYVINK